MVMWTNTHCFDFFHVILYCLNYVQNYRPSASVSIHLINLFKVTTYLSCGEDYLSYQMCSNT